MTLLEVFANKIFILPSLSNDKQFSSIFYLFLFHSYSNTTFHSQQYCGKNQNREIFWVFFREIERGYLVNENNAFFGVLVSVEVLELLVLQLRDYCPHFSSNDRMLTMTFSLKKVELLMLSQRIKHRKEYYNCHNFRTYRSRISPLLT